MVKVPCTFGRARDVSVIAMIWCDRQLDNKSGSLGVETAGQTNVL